MTAEFLGGKFYRYDTKFPKKNQQVLLHAVQLEVSPQGHANKEFFANFQKPKPESPGGKVGYRE